MTKCNNLLTTISTKRTLSEGKKIKKIKNTKISEFLSREVHKLCIFSSFIDPMELQDKRTPSNNPCIQSYRVFQGKFHLSNVTMKIIEQHKLPAPRGKKSFPTTLSNTEDFPELYNQLNHQHY